MTAIEKALAAINSQGLEGQISYRTAAKIYGVAASTLTRRHQNKTRSRAAAARPRRLLSPQQEKYLVQHIEKLSKRSTPPSQEMIKKYVANIAKRQLSNSWFTRFLWRNREKIITRNTAGIDQNCKKANDFKDYYNYFRLLYDYIEKYDI
ncbi:uncharacterized protein SETTUDRAFT_98903 [Exserohilum turcica Et28A]|uniref:HTH CENPB-type domain-containing protein n=1 Tax=Exserohilum turcicum (strain 28A) TaxID=671987 RepID=R0JZV3_EXST2|nr:uncharacterized protein SETTUDRAFT_98903 [Exserohilum turcica Et28A]EOA81717.1 hypothetical protein SETTUDRAFT_98903 [Exserohilum turcica Et28A]